MINNNTRIMQKITFLFCLIFNAAPVTAHDKAPKTPFQLGIENEHDSLWHQLRNKKVGLITNQTGVTQSGARTIDVLMARGLVVTTLFAPEHGINGEIAAEKKVTDSVDERTRIPIVSLYGHGSGKKIAAHMLADIDVLIFDMQDSGMRHFTYISTLLHIMQAAAEHGVPIAVLDRPNPLGAVAEGPLILKDRVSFIAAAPIPLRYGMTIGELAHFFNTQVLTTQAELHVVPMRDFTRGVDFHTTMPPLSPFVHNHAACIGYSFLGLLGEVRPFDTGLGTDKALQVFALPEQVKFSRAQWQHLAQALKNYGIVSKGVTYYSARKKKQCYGLSIQTADINGMQSFSALLYILKYMHDAKVPLEFSQYFDVAVGSTHVRAYVRGTITKKQLAAEVNGQLQSFAQKMQGRYLYLPEPKLNFVA